MKGSIYKRCTRCPRRNRLKDGARRCEECGSTSFSWYFTVDIGSDASGRRRQRRRGGFDTKKEAERALREVLVKVDRDSFVEPSDMTVQDFLVDEWMPVMRRKVRRSTWGRRRNYIETRILPRIGHVRLQELTPPMLNRLYADIEENGRVNGDAPLAPKTVRDAHKILHRALKDAVRWGYVERNVAEMADPPSAKLVNAARKEAIRTWSGEQLLHFLELMRDDPWFPLWIVAATTGLRRSELLGLRWRDVDLLRGRLAVRQVLVTSDGVPLLEPITKNSNARVVDIDPRVVAILRAHRTDQEAQRRAAGEAWEDHGLVFTRADGHWLNPDHVSHEFVRMNQEARPSSHQVARSEAHARLDTSRGGRADQGCPGATRPPLRRLHDRHLPARHSGHATAGRTAVR